MFGAVWYWRHTPNRPTPFSWGTADLCGHCFYWTVHVWITISPVLTSVLLLSVLPKWISRPTVIQPWKQFQDWQDRVCTSELSPWEHMWNSCACWRLEPFSVGHVQITPVIINLSMIGLYCSFLQVRVQNGNWCQSISGKLLIGKSSPWSDHKKKRRSSKIIKKQEKNSKILKHSHLFIT